MDSCRALPPLAELPDDVVVALSQCKPDCWPDNVTSPLQMCREEQAASTFSHGPAAADVQRAASASCQQQLMSYKNCSECQDAVCKHGLPGWAAHACTHQQGSSPGSLCAHEPLFMGPEISAAFLHMRQWPGGHPPILCRLQHAARLSNSRLSSCGCRQQKASTAK